MGYTYYMSDLLTRYLFLGETIPSPFATKNPYIGLVTGHPAADVDVWYEVTAPEYTRIAMNPYIDVPGAYVRLAAPISFPTATSTWGNVLGAVVFDESTIGTGNTIYDVPWTDSYFTQIPSYTITSGCTLTLTTFAFVASIRGMTPYSNDYGSTSEEFSKAILNWMFNIAPVPYARTYDIAIGRNANYDPDRWARFTGDWTECSGTGYQRVPMETTDWEGIYTPVSVQNINEIVFTEGAGDDWGLISDVVLYVHNTNTPAFWAHLETPITVYKDQAFAIGAGKLKIHWGGKSIY